MVPRAAVTIGIALLLAAPATGARPPKVSPPANVTVEATYPGGAVVSYRAARAPGALTIAYSKRSGTLFRLGTTVVTVTARYRGRKTARATFTVRVLDTTPPAFGALADVAAEATSGAGAAIAYDRPTAADLVDGTVLATCTPAPGSLVPLGASTVTCTARDRAGNSASATFGAKVVDTTAPKLLTSDVTVTGTSSSGAAVAYKTPTATDLVDPSPIVTCSPASGSQFPVGSTTVSCTGRDAAGNSVTATFKVEVLRPPPAEVGNYSGTISSGGAITFKVTSGGANAVYIVDVAIAISAPCSPDGTVTGTLTFALVSVNSDGTFSRTGPGSVSGEVQGSVTSTFAGTFTTMTSATGTIDAVVTVTSTSPNRTCSTGTVTWSASRS